jgi:uncharacterized protein with PIN domain
VWGAYLTAGNWGGDCGTSGSLVSSDWPYCNGSLAIPNPAVNYGALVEYIHRTLSVVVSVILVATIVAVSRMKPRPIAAFRALILSLALLVVQVALGAVVINSNLNAVITALHLANATALFAVMRASTSTSTIRSPARATQKAQPRPILAVSESPKFAADAMLGSLARKLRIFGFDTVYFREGPDSQLLALAKAEERVVLTSDRALVANARKRLVVALLIEGRDERERLASLEVAALKESLVLTQSISRCALCNKPLESLRRADVGSALPSGIVRRHRVYFRCPDCRKLYWKGGHWRKLRRLSSVLSRQ